MRATRLALVGLLAGFVFPVGGAVISAGKLAEGLSGGAMLGALGRDPVVWLLWAMPMALGALGWVVGSQQDALARRRDDLLKLARVRRDDLERTAAELARRARALADSVAKVDAATSGTAASVRETSATMEQLSRTATASALTAETVIGLARVSEHKSGEGLRSAEASREALLHLSDEVLGLSQLIAGLNRRMADLSGIASDMGRLADGSRALAERAREGAADGRPGAGVAAMVEQLTRHAEEATAAEAHGKGLLAEVHQAMHGAVEAAESGSVRAGEGAMVIEGAAGTMRDLARALSDSARAAREIARVAQEQDAGIEQAMKAMNSIYLAAEETAASTARVAAEARSLDELAARLRKAARPPLGDSEGAPDR
jgi:methyl-accepting chemotaxis protein